MVDIIMAYQWTTPIRYVRGLGPTKARELNKIGINTVGDLLEYQPLHYIYPGGVSIAEAKEGHIVIKAKIKSIKWAGFHTSTRMVATLDDDTGTCKAEWYNARYVSQQLHSGMVVTFWGRLKDGVLQQPKWTTVESSMADVYGGQYGVHHQTIRAALKEVLLSDVELPEIADGHTSWDRAVTYFYYHFPADKEDQQRASQQLKFDEALQLQLALVERRRGKERVGCAPLWWGTSEDVNIMGYFPYNFTDNQAEVMNAVIRDVTNNTPMQRLIHGEVGSGKTAVAFYAAMLAALNGKRTLILCPTTILAQQHYDTLKGMGWDDISLCLSGQTDPITGTNHVVIGTHAILYNDFLLRNSALVVIDEFQKFGVKQRAKLQQNNPHLLLLSATPIPRTLAASVFGDLDVSTIRQLPIERGTVVTRWVLPEKLEAMCEIIERELVKGHQAYFVYPRISGGDEDVVNATDRFCSLRDKFGDNYMPYLLTGQTKPLAKTAILREFKCGTIPILVSTIIAEVGLDNSNATVMVINGADRFGLSQLHQLRGRVCRSKQTAYCFLVSDTANEKSIARLDVIEKCNDGFEIAEHDLRLRGPGSVFGIEQHGLPDLKFVSLIDDYDLMIEARDLVQSGDIGDGIREMMELKYGDNLSLGGVV